MTKIYYFSGTGNTYWSAKKLADRLGDAELFAIQHEVKKEHISIEADTVVFMFPAYAYGMPVMMRRFMDSASIRAGYVAALVSYGSSPGGALAEAARVLHRKGIALDYAGRIPAVENYIPIFGAQSVKIQAKRLAMQKAATEKAASDIASKKRKGVLKFHPFASFVSALFRFACPNMARRMFKLTDMCTSCGFCAAICPAGAITMSGNKPVFGTKCEQCQACINFCPQHAITFARMTRTTAQYHHPEVALSELFAGI